MGASNPKPEKVKKGEIGEKNKEIIEENSKDDIRKPKEENRGNKENEEKNKIKILNPAEKKKINIDIKEDEIQKHLLKETRDNYFNKLIQFENNLLKDKLLEGQKKDKECNLILEGGDLQFDLKEMGIDDDSNNNNNLKEKIIKNEETEKVMEEKIINKIIKIKNDNEQHKIKHLKIFLVGINKIGKTTLSNYIFELEEQNQNELKSEYHENFIIYSKENFPIKIIEFKGLGYNENNNVEKIAQDAIKCINEQKEKNEDYNEYVHCIWYLISGERFSQIENDFLVKLRSSYQDLTIPIILVYNLLSKESSLKMKKYIEENKNCKEMDFIEVLPVENREIQANRTFIPFGRENLIKKTLLKCSKSLKGDMITLMTNNISHSVKEMMLKLNKEIEKEIIASVENKIKDFKTVLSDEELKSYVVKLFENSIYHFYKDVNNNNLSNESLSLLNKSNFIQKIDKFIQYYKPEFEKIINLKLDEIAKTLIDEQASIEKEGDNMKVDFKRNIKIFKETTTVYFKRNYYFISQKYILNEVNNIILKKFIESFRLKLDKIVKTLLENKNNYNINSNLKNCFLEKLKNFASTNKINVDIRLMNSLRNIDNNENDNNKENLNEPPPILKRNNSIDIIIQFDIDQNDYNEINDNPKPKEMNWFIYKKKKWKYLNIETKNSLKNFLENNMIYQETYFNQINNENNEIFEKMKEYEEKQLVNFFNEHYKAFMKDKICNDYNEKNLLVDRNNISKIIYSQIFEQIYLYKLNNIAKLIKSELNFCKIKYITIIAIGRTGVGKSTLINSILKEEKALTGTGNIVTKENKLYSSDSIPFLRIIDTRGIELKSEFGPEKILDNAIKVINNSEKQKDFSDFVNCIWYCVSDIYIEDNEIEIIRKLRQKKKNIPIIIVYSHALIQECFNNIHKKLKENFPDAIIIPVLAKQADNKNSFGLNELLDISIDACKNAAINGKIFNSMKERIKEYILGYFKKNHEELKQKANCLIANYFINNFKEVLNDEQLTDYIYKRIEDLFIEYLKINDLYGKEGVNMINDSFKNITNLEEFLGNFINHYKGKTKELIDSIVDKMSLDFIDRQVYFEKMKLKNINKTNKCNLKDFKKIIDTFLKDNFYYISQKYIINKFITESFEEISEDIEMYSNKLVEKLVNNNSLGIFETIFNKKFEDYENVVNSHRINNKIYNVDENDLGQTTLGFSAYLKDLSSAPGPIANF